MEVGERGERISLNYLSLGDGFDLSGWLRSYEVTWFMDDAPRLFRVLVSGGVVVEQNETLRFVLFEWSRRDPDNH
jgi:hypothetical protein